MDKNGKLFGKISIVDLVVLILILAAIAGAVYRFTAPAASLAEGDITLHYTLRIQGVRDFTFQNYQAGLPAFDGLTGQYIGEIVHVRYEPHYQMVTTLDGSVIFAPVPGQIQIFVYIEANGRSTGQIYFAEGTFEVAVGSTVRLRFKYIEVISTVYSLTTSPR